MLGKFLTHTHSPPSGGNFFHFLFSMLLHRINHLSLFFHPPLSTPTQATAAGLSRSGTNDLIEAEEVRKRKEKKITVGKSSTHPRALLLLLCVIGDVINSIHRLVQLGTCAPVTIFHTIVLAALLLLLAFLPRRS